MNKGSIVERLCSDLDRKEPRYKSPTLLLFTWRSFVPVHQQQQQTVGTLQCLNDANEELVGRSYYSA